MNKLKNNKKIFLVLGILGLVLITTGVTYAFFTYAQSGTTENSIKSGSITFWYDEQNREGNSIGITDALPISDTDGKSQTKAFNFRITSTTGSTIAIPYTITLRQKANTDDIGNIVKVYLAKTTGYDASVASEEEVVTSLYSSLNDITKNGYSEKVLYRDSVPAGSSNYNQNYRLKMWVDENADYSDGTLNNKKFTVMVNVYAEAHTASSNANITSVGINGTQLTSTTENNYETTLPQGTTSATLNIETEDEYATVSITKTESDYTTPVADNGSIQRLSYTQNKTLNLTNGDNYFKVIVSSEDNSDSKELHLKTIVIFPLGCTLQSGTAKTVSSMYICNLGDNTNRYFYVLSVDNTNNTVDLILDRNITQGTSTPTMNWNDAIVYFDSGDGLAIKNSWTKVIKVDLPSAQAIADAGGIIGWNYNTAATSNFSYFGVNSTSDTSQRSNYNWLYNYTNGCSSAGCDAATSLSSPEAYGYWTKDLVQNNSSFAWYVNWDGILFRDTVSTSTARGVRPVVTISQSELN